MCVNNPAWRSSGRAEVERPLKSSRLLWTVGAVAFVIFFRLVFVIILFLCAVSFVIPYTFWLLCLLCWSYSWCMFISACCYFSFLQFSVLFFSSYILNLTNVERHERLVVKLKNNNKLKFDKQMEDQHLLRQTPYQQNRTISTTAMKQSNNNIVRMKQNKKH